MTRSFVSDLIAAVVRPPTDQASHIFSIPAATVPSGRRLANLAQLVVTVNLGIAMEEVLRPGTIDPDLLAHLITVPPGICCRARR